MRMLKGKEIGDSLSGGGKTIAFSSSADNLYDDLDHNVKCNIMEKVDWILDTGAIDHMTGDESLLYERKRLKKAVSVRLPDGS